MTKEVFAIVRLIGLLRIGWRVNLFRHVSGIAGRQERADIRLIHSNPASEREAIEIACHLHVRADDIDRRVGRKYIDGFNPVRGFQYLEVAISQVFYNRKPYRRLILHNQDCVLRVRLKLRWFGSVQLIVITRQGCAPC